MSDLTYAVHTATCTYLLDEEGICRWVFAASGRAARDADRAMGAQFVACLDLRAEGGLVGELREGASALLCREIDGRFVLLRTPPIERVEYRGEAEEWPSPLHTPVWPRGYSVDAQQAVRDEKTEPPPPDFAPPAARTDEVLATMRLPLPDLEPYTSSDALPAFAPPSSHQHPGHTTPLPVHWQAPSSETQPFPEYGLPPEITEDPDLVGLDSEDLMSISVTEVTISLPLYRNPPAPARPAPPPGPFAVPAPTPPPRPRAPAPPAPAPAPQEPLPPDPRYAVPVGQPPKRSLVGPGRRLR